MENKQEQQQEKTVGPKFNATVTVVKIPKKEGGKQ